MNKKLTILLTLWDRPQFTFRWMKYANQNQFPFKILIADGGKDKTVEKELQKYSNFPNLNYKYVRFPYDENYSYYYKKIASSLDLIDTEFTVLADSDDFFYIDGLIKSVDFLLKNESYSSCGGKHYKMRIRSSKSNDYYLYGEKITFTNLGRNKAKSVVDNNRLKRLDSYYSNYRNNWYDIHYTKNLKDFWNLIVEINPMNVHHPELMIGGFGSSTGKIKRLDFKINFIITF